MKLLYCPSCRSVFSLTLQSRTCPGCKGCGGKYIDELNAEWWGQAIPIGFANSSFIHALANQPEWGLGKTFTPPSEDKEAVIRVKLDCFDSHVNVMAVDSDGGCLPSGMICKISTTGIYRYTGVSSKLGFDQDECGSLVDLNHS